MFLYEWFLALCLVREVALKQTFPNLKEDNHLKTFIELPGLFQNKCIDDLGCFWTGPPFWHPVHRPVSRIPARLTGTRFLLYTPQLRNQPQQLNLTKESVADSGFERELGTKILIHGYVVELKEDEDVRFKMKDELLDEGAYNVVIVDWDEHNKFPYSQAVANARVVAAQIAKLIRLAMTHKGISPRSIHLIGHSLGGQIAGWVGERVPNIGRITGLDPAGPFFHNAENVVRLDTSDAEFVDIIHTNGGDNPIDGLGIKETIGHMDFYPNGGTRQPGCFFNLYEDNDFNATFERLVANSCDHSRANFYFLESIKNCTFFATQCESYAAFENGECSGGAVVEMGLHTRKIPKVEGGAKFFLKTHGERPFCTKEEDGW
ncbi:hypothetical protein JTE90_017996 [Oedothorax gibbosus]|uniref:Lipase domain-containing protein n=1 Tax=Oedothorax gibbosus TaxID=931172 RepID=A0AAV6V8A9_9ARAC|nr:hypothetical protein JTE90_017996 [Oedothorax gibbosus]